MSQQTKPLIVLTDDVDDLRRVFRVTLERAGYDVIDTPSSEEVIHICKSQKVSLVISDVMRPDISGIELREQLRANSTTAYIPYMLCTAVSLDEQEVERLDVSYLQKPFYADELVTAVRHFLEGRL